MTTSQHAMTILVVDDDPTLNRLLCAQLKAGGYRTVGAQRWSEVEAALQKHEPAVALLDMKLPDAEGIEKLAQLTEFCPVIVLTAYGSIDQAVQAVKHGAFDYLTKPVNPDVLELAVRRCLANSSLRRNFELLKRQTTSTAARELVGESSAMTELRKMIDVVGPSGTTVLIVGESGVGKELVAAAVHKASDRAGSNFIAVNCATLQQNLFESELFGHERGAFTGADRRKEGLVEVGAGGTVFLDEIGEMSLAVQAKLLRVIETGHFRRVGGTKDLTANVRFVAATNRDLEAMCREGTFRSDLFYRLSAFILRVPPLRERLDDIPVLAEHFLGSREFSRGAPKHISPGVLDLMMSYNWPGNIRELRNIIERAALLSGTDTEIRVSHVGSLRRSGPLRDDYAFSFDHVPTLDEIAAVHFDRLLNTGNYNRAEIARLMGVSERQLYRMLGERATNAGKQGG
jgi:two-component system NtrC family response regulator